MTKDQSLSAKFFSFLALLGALSISFPLRAETGASGEPRPHTEALPEGEKKALTQEDIKQPQPVKSLVESYVDRRYSSPPQDRKKPSYHPSKDFPYQPQPRDPSQCEEEVRLNDRICQNRQRRQDKWGLDSAKKCAQYRRWFQTRCQKQKPFKAGDL